MTFQVSQSVSHIVTHSMETFVIDEPLHNYDNDFHVHKVIFLSTRRT